MGIYADECRNVMVVIEMVAWDAADDQEIQNQCSRMESKVNASTDIDTRAAS